MMSLHFVPRSALASLLALALSHALAAAEPVSLYKFQFAGEQAVPGFTRLGPTTIYSQDTGFGFEPGAVMTSAGQPFSFSVAVPEGNYRVTATLGDPQAETVVTVKAETRRLLLEHLRIPAGKIATHSFMVNVRGPKISTGGEVNLDSRELNLTTREVTSRSWDDKLTLSFSDAHPALVALEIQKYDEARTVFITGDSTVTDQPANGSWGQMLPRWFQPDVAVANHAESGETLKGFLKERRWEKVLDTARPGDWVIIEFGTNDSKARGPQNIYPGQDFAETYAPADTTYRELLRQFVADVKRKRAFPIIVSPSARRGETDAATTSLAPWANAAMATARELDVPGINLNAMGVDLNLALGTDASRQFADGTHHAEYGAYLQAKCIALGIKQLDLSLAKFLVADLGDFDPKHPEPLPANIVLPPDPNSGRGGRGPRGGNAAAATPAAAPASLPPAAAPLTP